MRAAGVVATLSVVRLGARGCPRLWLCPRAHVRGAPRPAPPPPPCGSATGTQPSHALVCVHVRAVCGSINRADVADLVVRALRSGKADGKVVSAVDKDQVFGAPQFEVLEL